MATTELQTSVATQYAGEVRLIALSEIRVDRNVRQQLLDDEVTALAGSIELLGQITPAIVRADDAGGFVLVAGHKRYAALTKLGRSEMRCEIRAAEAEHAERAAENIVSCRGRHETINADHDGMPTDRRAGSDARHASDARSA